MSGCEVWVHHGKEVLENEPVVEDVTDEVRMDEMLNAICPEYFEDPLLRRFKSFYSSLKLQKMHCTSTRQWLFFLL
jgi:hypothetical protein